MNRRQRVKVTGILLVFSMISAASADVMMFIPSQDASLYEDPGGQFANGSGQYLFMGRTWDQNGIDALLRRSLVQFDLSAIPADSLINSVTLDFEINQVALNSQIGTALIHRVTAAWTEGPSNPIGPEGQGTTTQAGDSSWIHRSFPNQLWTTPGGDFNPVSSGSAPFSTGPQTMTFVSTAGMVNDVQSWTTNPATNFGWVLIGDEVNIRNARRMDSRENMNTQPTLTVDFTPGALTIFIDGFEE